jgi:hypothetical protein
MIVKEVAMAVPANSILSSRINPREARMGSIPNTRIRASRVFPSLQVKKKTIPILTRIKIDKLKRIYLTVS